MTLLERKTYEEAMSDEHPLINSSFLFILSKIYTPALSCLFYPLAYLVLPNVPIHLFIKNPRLPKVIVSSVNSGNFPVQKQSFQSLEKKVKVRPKIYCAQLETRNNDSNFEQPCDIVFSFCFDFLLPVLIIFEGP